MNSVSSCLEQHRIIVIIRRLENRHLIPSAEAVHRGGIRMIEVAFDTSGQFPDSYVIDQISALHRQFGDDMLVGAGTVLTPDQAAKAHEAGASFIISPNTDPDVIHAVKNMGMVSIPGAMTPTEMQAAYSAGADYVKIFPSDILGPDYFRAVLSPLAHIKALAVGGIDERNITSFRLAGAAGFGIGSAILRRDAIVEQSYGDLTLYAKRMTELACG